MDTIRFPANSVSIIVPIYNEFESIPLLYQRITSTMENCGRDYELILVDDGSTDGSTRALRKLAREDDRIKVVVFKRNFGQTAAMCAGIEQAAKDYVVTIDGDLQNEPDDIPAMLNKLEEGYDLVHGWRKDRQDHTWRRKVPSKIANWLISRVTGFRVRDLGCTLKAMTLETAQDLELYGEMHRFIPILAHARGARCAEIETRHHPRKFGTTKYGLDRTLRVILDLITVRYMTRHFASPMQFFGRLGMYCLGFGIAIGITMVLMKVLSGVDMTGNPLLLLSAGTMIASLQLFCMGVLGEIAARNYFASGVRQSYVVREVVKGRSAGRAQARILKKVG